MREGYVNHEKETPIPDGHIRLTIHMQIDLPVIMPDETLEQYAHFASDKINDGLPEALLKTLIGFAENYQTKKGMR